MFFCLYFSTIRTVEACSVLQTTFSYCDEVSICQCDSTDNDGEVHNDGAVLRQYEWVQEGVLRAVYEPFPPLMWNPNSTDNINRTIRK